MAIKISLSFKSAVYRSDRYERIWGYLDPEKMG
jgi:hypothetical protein